MLIGTLGAGGLAGLSLGLLLGRLTGVLRIQRQLDTLESAVERITDRLVSWEDSLLPLDVQNHMWVINSLRSQRHIAACSIDATAESLYQTYDEPIQQHYTAIQEVLAHRQQ